jgi:hypothetical protein
MAEDRAGPYGPTLQRALVVLPRGPQMAPFGFLREAHHGL